MDRPVKLYKSVEEARLALGGKLLENLGKRLFPCLTCGGYGRIMDPNEARDVNEGWKYANRITCPKCNGDKTCQKKEFCEWYYGYIDEYKKELQKYEEYERVRRVALSKLTKEERKVLGL